MQPHDHPKSLRQWLEIAGLAPGELAEKSGVPLQVVEAIVASQYTPSPQQRFRLANVLGLAADDICWGHAIEPQTMYGHGPQFGRSP